MNKACATAWLLLAVSFTQGLSCQAFSLVKHDNKSGSFINKPNDKLSADEANQGVAQKSVQSKTLTPLSLDKKNAPANSASGILEKAKDVNAIPLTLMESAEQDAKASDEEKAEGTQITDLWEATLKHSPDLQFVIQRLVPTTDPSHAATVMMKMLSTAIYGAIGATRMIVPNSAVTLGGSGVASIVSSLVNGQESKKQKQARLTQTETIMLYNMIRDTADKLVDHYRNYRKNVFLLSHTLTDLEDLQAMISDARAGQDGVRQFELEYTLRKAKRDVFSVGADMKHYRQSLVDLAGGEAVDKLDKQLQEEQINFATPIPVDEVHSDIN